MDIKAFEYVDAIVKYGSLSEAAEALYISQPVLSQYINNLEKNLGKKLFLRKHHKLEITPAGKIFVREGRDILNLYYNMQHKLEGANEEEIVNVRLGISHFYGKYYLPDILTKFSKEYPNVRFSITEALTSELEDLVLSGKLDACLIPFYEYHDGLDYHMLSQEEILVAVPADSGINHHAIDAVPYKKLDISCLRDENFVLLSESQGFHNFGTALCEEHEFTPNIICKVLNWDTLNLLVYQGMGIGFVPAVIAESEQKENSPNYYRIEGEWPVTRPFGIVTNGKTMTPMIKMLVDFVIYLSNQGIIPNVGNDPSCQR